MAIGSPGSRVILIVATAVAVTAALYFSMAKWRAPPDGATAAGDERAVSGRATADLPSEGEGHVSAADTGAAPTDDSAELQRIELGNLDEQPWVYGSEAERLAAQKAAVERARIRPGRDVANIQDGLAAIDEAKAVTGDGPSTAKSGLPGPGETQIGGVRIGPAPQPAAIAGPAPEQGTVGRDSQGPAKPGAVDPKSPSPGSGPPDPEAPGPSG